MDTPQTESSWWHGATLYQIYVRSWRDSDGDGYGDGWLSRAGSVPDLFEDTPGVAVCGIEPQNGFGRHFGFGVLAQLEQDGRLARAGFGHRPVGMNSIAIRA